MNILNVFTQLARDESGATAIEYGLIAALISIAAIVAFTTVGTELTSVFEDVGEGLATRPQ
jgi:pilus assembly protein Flp/PilA